MVRTVLGAVILLVLSLSLSSGEELKVVRLVAVGDVEEKLLQRLVSALRDKLGVAAEIGQGIKIPDEAYNSSRGQYYSTEILKKLEVLRPRSGVYLLGVTESDLYVPTLRFVFGEAMPARDVAIISLCRLRQEFYGSSPDRPKLEERMIKEAVHELGHVWGMAHCSDPLCVMFFSNSLADTDRKSDTFCKRCKVFLKGDAN